MELTLAAPAQADSKDVLGSHKDWLPDGFDPGVLRAELEALQLELERLNEQLGAAVVDGDERRMGLLEGRIDALTVRQKGLIAEIAEWEATIAATADRARRRQEAAERERKRRELVATRTQLYRSLSASLAHQTHIAQLARELERLRLAPPVEQAHLEALRQRLSEAGLAFDTLSDELSTCEDPERLQAAALHYQLLAGSAEERAASLGESRSSPATVAAQPVGSDSPALSEPQTRRRRSRPRW